MGKIYVKATPVSPFSAVQSYNWASKTPLIGTYDIGAVWTDPPLINTGSGVLNNFLNPQGNPTITLGSTTILPNPVYQPTLGEIVQAYEPSLGWGEFILLSIPKSTAVPVGTLVQWDCQYSITVLPAKSTSQKTAVPLAVAVATCGVTSGNPTVKTDGSGTASNSTNVMYTWFQIGGRAWTLKTNVQITPASAVYVSATAGRVYVTASAGGTILGARAAPGTTTTTQSTVLIWYNRCSLEGA